MSPLTRDDPPPPPQERIAEIAGALRAAAAAKGGGDMGALRGALAELIAEATVLSEMAADEGYFAVRDVLSDAAGRLRDRASEAQGAGSFAGAAAAGGRVDGIPPPAVIGVQMMAGRGFEYVREGSEAAADDDEEERGDDDGESGSEGEGDE